MAEEASKSIEIGSPLPLGRKNNDSPSSDDLLVRRYNFQKRVIRWAAFFLLGIVISLFIYQAASPEAATSLAELRGRLGKNAYFEENTCVLSATIDGRQQVLISKDSGYSFIKPNFSWPVHDSDVILHYLPKKNIILALERKGMLRAIQPELNRYDTVDVSALVDDSAIGMARRYTDDSVFVYGKFSSLISVAVFPDSVLLRPIRYARHNALHFKSLAFNSAGKAAAVLGSINGGRLFTSSNLIEWSLFGDSLKNDSDTKKAFNSFILTEPIAVERFVESLYQDYYTKPILRFVNFEPNTRQLYYTSDSSSIGDYRLRLFNLDRPTTNMLSGLPQTASMRYAMLDHNGQPIVYGYDKYIASTNGTDSIPYASYILNIAPNNRQALIANPQGNYLFRKNDVGNWKLNGIMIAEPTSGSWVTTAFVAIFILALMIVYFLYLALKSKKRIDAVLKERNQENALFPKSEKPLSVLDEDLLGFAGLEDAVHHILKNPQLQMPMSIVVSGTWGSGKTSMMNRIREKLEKDPEVHDEFMTTWFNAWHLQGEASLLNSFLLNIIGTYERYYSFFSPFRIKIAAGRFSRLSFVKKFAFGFALAIILPVLLSIIALLWQQIMGEELPVSAPSYIPDLHSISSIPGSLSELIINPVIAGLLAVFSLIFLNRQYVPTGLSAFFELLPKNNFVFDVEKQEAGSREKFRQQYWEIMTAGRKDKKLAIFIDDLDRITGDKILELLEGINFISDIASRPPEADDVTPNVIFILGMYTEEVARLVGNRLKEINGSEEPPLLLGSNYIEKMVQLVVPVPFDTNQNLKLKMLYENP